MTIKVTIKNEDQRPTAVIAVKWEGGEAISELAAGESMEGYVTSTSSLVVSEVSQ